MLLVIGIGAQVSERELSTAQPKFSVELPAGALSQACNATAGPGGHGAQLALPQVSWS